jgi:hypothetical protein
VFVQSGGATSDSSATKIVPARAIVVPERRKSAADPELDEIAKKNASATVTYARFISLS